MQKKCPFCESYDTIFLGKKHIGEIPEGVWGCRKCFKIFVDDVEEDTAPVARYNPKFKNAYLKKKIPEISEHEKFRYEDKVTQSDITDLKIVWYLLKHGKSLEDLLNG